MKLLSIAIPSYNSEAYLKHAVDSLLPGGDEVEILIVNDGSKDGTAEIADDYERRYPGIVRAVHKENGGHGDAVMTGLANATGLYFKVVDSDDWVDDEAYPKVLDCLRGFVDEPIDLLISNYIFDKVGVTHKKVIHAHGALPIGRIFGWEEARHFKKGQYLMMHSMIYRTQLLRDCGLSLPKSDRSTAVMLPPQSGSEQETLYFLSGFECEGIVHPIDAAALLGARDRLGQIYYITYDIADPFSRPALDALGSYGLTLLPWVDPGEAAAAQTDCRVVGLRSLKGGDRNV